MDDFINHLCGSETMSVCDSAPEAICEHNLQAGPLARMLSKFLLCFIFI